MAPWKGTFGISEAAKEISIQDRELFKMLNYKSMIQLPKITAFYLLFLEFAFLLLAIEKPTFAADSEIKDQGIEQQSKERSPANYRELPTELKIKIQQSLDTPSKSKMHQVSKADHEIGKKELELHKIHIDAFAKTLPDGANILDEAVFRNRPDIIKATGEIKMNLLPTEGMNFLPTLISAAQHNNAELLKEFYAHPNLKNTTLALHDAATRGDAKVLKALLDAGANPNAKDAFGATPLHMAARNGHTESVKALIDAKANPNAENKNTEKTPLHMAAESGHTESVKALIDAKADPNAKDLYKVTPLHLAAQSGHTESVKVLIDTKANPNAEDSNKKTPLHYARGHQEIMKILKEAETQAGGVVTSPKSPINSK